MTKFWAMFAVCLAAFAAEAAEEKDILHPHPVSLSPQGRGNTENNTDGEVKFKNPVFYEKMKPLSRSTNPVRITPDFIEFDMKEDGSAKGPCELLENEDNYITVRCIVVYPNGDEDTYKLRYTIEGCWMEEEPFCDLKIREDDIDSRGTIPGKFPDEKIDGQSWYIVEQPKK